MNTKTEPAKKTVEAKEIDLTIIETEVKSVIVKLDGWRKRVYSDNEEIIKRLQVGNTIKVEYTGDIEDVHSVVFEKLK